MDSSLVPLLTGTGGAVAVLGAVVILFILGVIVPKSVISDKNKEITELKQALQQEREASKAAITAASSTRDILAAIQVGRDISGHEKAGP